MSTAERMYDDHRDRWRGPSMRIHPAWIILLVLGFIVWWPIGLAILAFTFWSKNMGCTSGDRWQRKMERMEEKMGRMRDRVERFGSARLRPLGRPPLERQSRLRRVPQRDAAPPRRRAARVPRLPRAAALREGQTGVRPVHGRSAQPPDARSSSAAELTSPAALRFPGRSPKGGRPDAFQPVAKRIVHFRSGYFRKSRSKVTHSQPHSIARAAYQASVTLRPRVSVLMQSCWKISQ